ncbi:MAG TPA: carboxypeptidase regulatory-like domain-containing protein [Bryobacteraceae bacterium]|jgi:hypothetical protein
MKLIEKCILTGLLSVLGATALLAQSTGSLRGQVTDPSGAGIPGATVTLSGPADTVKVASTDATGNYIIVGLPGGQYTVRVAAPGFTLFERTNLELSVGRGGVLDVPLTVAVEKQEVTVQDNQGIQIDPEKNAGAIVLKGEDLDFLSDDPDDLQNDLLALAGPSVGPNGGQIYIDGFSNGQLPPKENIREIRINSNPFSSEYDRPGFGRIEIFTKPGTDKFRGNALVNFNDSIFNSRNPFSNTARPNYTQRQAQTNFTGPLTKKSSFNMEFDYRKQDMVSLIQAKDPFQLGNSFSQIFTPGFLGTSLYSFYPDYSTRYSVGPRIDYQLTKNITLSGRYTFQHVDSPNSGLGGFGLPPPYSTAELHNSSYQSTAQLTETQVIGARAVNESRFQYHHTGNTSVGTSIDPQINVSQAFYLGGAAALLTYNHQSNYEFQNNTSLTRNKHFIKFGVRIRGVDQTSYSPSNYSGTYSFGGISCSKLDNPVANPLCAANPGGLISGFQSYAATQLGLSQGMTMAQIRSAYGVGPTQYSVAGGQPLVSVSQIDAAPFIQDDWRVIPSMTLSLGMRYEVQNNIGNKNAWAPRIGLAWGLGGGQNRGRNPKTVLRAGFGLFYDRVGLGDTLAALRENGFIQQNYLLNPALNPGLDVFPNVLSTTQLAGFQQSQNILILNSHLQAPQMLQSAIGVDRQLPKNMTLSVNVTDTRGLHQLREININTPVQGTFDPNNRAAAVYPLAGALNQATGKPYGSGPVFMYDSSGMFKQLQISTQLQARINNRVQMFGYYVWGEAHSNTDSQGTFPANPYDWSSEWGRAGFDRRQQIQIGGSVQAPLRIAFSPNINYTTAPPLNIVIGQDIYGDGLLSTARPAFATVPVNPAIGVISTPWGVFNTDPLGHPENGSVIIPRNYAQAYGQFRFNMRIGRTWGFGERVAGGNQQNRGNGGDNGGGGRGGFGGGGGRGGRGGGGFAGGGGRGGRGGGGGNGGSNNHYTVNLSAEIQNVLNTVNTPAPVTNLSSPFLGQSLAGTGGNALSNRRVNLSLRFSF